VPTAAPVRTAAPVCTAAPVLAAAPVATAAPVCTAAPVRQVEEEADELEVLWDEDMALYDPDALPRRCLRDFAIYNAEVGPVR
jgi:hypothetical protein